MKKLRVLTVCGGNGVLVYPFRKHKIMGNIEPRPVFYTKSQSQWNLNFPNTPMVRSLEKLPPIEKRLDLIIGHPDCGNGSVLRLSRAKERIKYSTNESLKAFVESVNHFKPRFFLLENLEAFANEFPEKELGILIPKYEFIYQLGSVSRYGNSQVSRKRLVIIGVLKKNKDEIKTKAFSAFKDRTICHNFKGAESFELGKEEIPEIGHVREPDKMLAAMKFDNVQLNYKQIREKWNTEFKNSKSWYVGGKMKNLPGVNKNLPGKAPLTVRKQNRQFGTKGYVLSPREMANIQGLPQSFKLLCTPGCDDKQKVYEINKARLTVTKTAPYEIGLYMLNRLNKIFKS